MRLCAQGAANRAHLDRYAFDVELGELLGPCIGYRIHGGFRCAINSNADHVQRSALRADIDDHALPAFPKVREKRGRGVDQPKEVGVELGESLFRCVFFDRPALKVPRIVYQEIDLAAAIG